MSLSNLFVDRILVPLTSTPPHERMTDQAPGILDFSVQNEIDLVVLETYGHKTLGKSVFGGVFEGVIQWFTHLGQVISKYDRALLRQNQFSAEDERLRNR